MLTRPIFLILLELLPDMSALGSLAIWNVTASWSRILPLPLIFVNSCGMYLQSTALSHVKTLTFRISVTILVVRTPSTIWSGSRMRSTWNATSVLREVSVPKIISWLVLIKIKLVFCLLASSLLTSADATLATALSLLNNPTTIMSPCNYCYSICFIMWLFSRDCTFQFFVINLSYSAL